MKLVRIIHRIGKKMMKPTIQASAVDADACGADCGGHAFSGLQVLADHADEEEGDDVGEHDRDDAAGRGAADVESSSAWA